MAEYTGESVSINSDVIETVVGAKTYFKGNVSTDKPMRIDGSFEGDINSTDLVVVSEGGSFNGTLQCRELRIGGTAQGTVTCTELMKFCGAGTFDGEATTKSIFISEDAVFDGKLKVSK